MSVEPLQLLLGRESGRHLASDGDFRAGHRCHVKDRFEVSHQQFHHQGLVGIVHQGGQGHLSVRLPRLHQRGAKDDAQVTCGHLVLFCLLCHSVAVKRKNEFTSPTGIFYVRDNKLAQNQSEIDILKTNI